MTDDLEKVISDEHFSAIGKVAAAWALMEGAIDEHSLRIGGIYSDIGACLTSQIAGPSRKLDALISLLKLRGFTDQIRKLNEIAKDITGLGERRNRVIHDMWIADEKTGGPHRFEISARRALKIEMIPVSTEDVLKVASDILAKLEELDAVIKPIVVPPLPSRGEPA